MAKIFKYHIKSDLYKGYALVSADTAEEGEQALQRIDKFKEADILKMNEMNLYTDSCGYIYDFTVEKE